MSRQTAQCSQCGAHTWAYGNGKPCPHCYTIRKQIGKHIALLAVFLGFVLLALRLT